MLCIPTIHTVHDLKTFTGHIQNTIVRAKRIKRKRKVNAHSPLAQSNRIPFVRSIHIDIGCDRCNESKEDNKIGKRTDMKKTE